MQFNQLYWLLHTHAQYRPQSVSTTIRALDCGVVVFAGFKVAADKQRMLLLCQSVQVCFGSTYRQKSENKTHGRCTNLIGTLLFIWLNGHFSLLIYNYVARIAMCINAATFLLTHFVHSSSSARRRQEKSVSHSLSLCVCMCARNCIIEKCLNGRPFSSSCTFFHSGRIKIMRYISPKTIRPYEITMSNLTHTVQVCVNC